MTRFQQVMAENGILREASGHSSREGVHIVDTLSDEGTFMEDILIHVGNRPRVGIDSDVAGKKPDKPGSSSVRQANA